MGCTDDVEAGLEIESDLSSPLLASPLVPENKEDAEVLLAHDELDDAPGGNGGNGAKGEKIPYVEHLKVISKLAYPIILSEIFQNFLPVVDIGFVGQLGKDELGAAALATAWFNLWNSTMVGFMTAVDTLLSQSYGRNEMEMYGSLTGISLLLVFLATIIMSGLMALSGPTMHLLGQDPKLAAMAGEFSLRLIPGLFPLYSFRVLTKYLQTQDILLQGIWIGMFANACNALFNWAFIFKLGWGIAGSPWATTLTRAIEFVVIVVYILIRKSRLKETFPRFCKEHFTKEVLEQFMSLGMSGAFSLSAIAWAFEITTLLAGLLGTIPLGAHIITLSLDGIIFQSFSFAIGIAASIQIGKLMGDRKPEEARRSSHAFFIFCITMQLVLIVILLFCRDELGNLFSSDEDVADLVAQLIQIMCVFMMGDAIQATNGGVLRGLGRQKLVLILNVVGIWIVGVTAGSILAFGAGLGIYGIWWGLVTGIYSTAIIGLFFFFTVRWEEECTKTCATMQSLSSSMSIGSSRSFNQDTETEYSQEGDADGEYHALIEGDTDEE
ncbi:hypothetical protein ACHAXR_011859 [Thalassiosira sp. AJA248-18]